LNTDETLGQLGLEKIEDAIVREQCGVPPPPISSLDTRAAHALLILNLYAETYASQFTGAVTMCATALVSYAKRGTASFEFLSKIQTGVFTEIGQRVNLIPDVIEVYYKAFGQFINAQNAEGLFTHWKNVIPQQALRLSLTVQQTANSGLTKLMVCHKALFKFPDFPWDVIADLLPTDWAGYLAASDKVGDNAYYGFARDLGVAKSTKYENISYVAKELLIKMGQDPALARYQGFIRVPQRAPAIAEIIQRYIAKKTEADTSTYDADNHMLPERMVNIVRDQAARYIALEGTTLEE